MYRADVELEIVPSGGDVVAVGIRTVKAQENKRLFHHLLCFEVDSQFRIIVRHIRKSESVIQCIGRGGEHDVYLWFLLVEVSENEIQRRETYLAKSTFRFLI